MSKTIYKFLKDNNTGLAFTASLLIAQSIHSSHSLFYLASSLNIWLRYPFAIISAIFLDALILYFTANKAKKASYGATVLCIALNLYSYHHEGGFEWFTYDSYFSLIPAIVIPIMVHKVGSIILPK